MARYYLDIVIGSRRIPDQDGSDWPDAEAARQGALQEIRSLMTNRIVDMLETKDCHIEVGDQAHRFLFKVDFLDAYGPKSSRG